MHQSVDQRAAREEEESGDGTTVAAGADANDRIAMVVDKTNALQLDAAAAVTPVTVGKDAKQAEGVKVDELDVDGEEDAEEEEEAEAEEGEAEGEDQILKNCRVATEADGLLTLEELHQLYYGASEGDAQQQQSPTTGVTAYGTFNEDEGNFFGVSHSSLPSVMFGFSADGMFYHPLHCPSLSSRRKEVANDTTIRIGPPKRLIRI